MDETENQFRPLREILPKEPQKALSISDQFQPPICPPDLATRRAGILLACFRMGDAENPEVYAASVASVLSCYPQAVAYRVTDPRTGLAGMSKWLPTVSEVKAACEAEMGPARAQDARLARQAHTEMVIAKSSSRIAADMWGRLQAEFPQHAPPRQYRAPEQLAAEYAANPITISAEALKPKEANL